MQQCKQIVKWVKPDAWIYTLLDSIHVKFQAQQNKCVVSEVKIVATLCGVAVIGKEHREVSKILVFFRFLIWVEFTQMCPFYANSLSCSFGICVLFYMSFILQYIYKILKILNKNTKSYTLEWTFLVTKSNWKVPELDQDATKGAVTLKESGNSAEQRWGQ